MSVYPRALQAARDDAKETADAFTQLLFWYIGARFPLRTTRSTSGASASGASASQSAFNPLRLAEELFVATESIASNGQKMLAAARQLSSMKNLSAVQKAEVTLEFFRKIGFGVQYTRGAAYVDEGAHLIMTSEDGLFAFKFMKDSGSIIYGKLSRETFEWIWTVL